MTKTILALNDVTKEFRVGKSVVTAVKNVTLDVTVGECLSLIHI